MTSVTRRGFLAVSAAFLAAPALVGRAKAAPSSAQTLTAEPVTAPLLGPDRPTSGLWGFNGSAPGPVLRYRIGETLAVRLDNCLPMPTAIHWHGLRLPNAMDGVPGLTQDPVGQGETFDYTFPLRDAGTFWYHSHQRSWEQVARGVYGLLIVDEADPPPVDQDLPLVIDDWQLDRDGRFVEETLGALHDWGHGGRMGNVVTVNNRVRPDIAVRQGERLRLRFLNPANARILVLTFDSLAPTVVALDGRPCTPHAVSDHGLLLGPGQRADLLVDVMAEPGARLPILDGAYGDPAPLAHLVVGERVARTKPSDAPLALAKADEGPALDLADAVHADLLMEGGAMGSMRDAMHNGRRMGWRELVQANRVWAFNGVAGDMDTPLMRIPRDRTATITIRNETRWPHAMHLHGHHFRVVERNGKPVDNAPWRDAELMGQGETLRLAFKADAPGKWMLHCHMLEHADGGMMTWVEVA